MNRESYKKKDISKVDLQLREGPLRDRVLKPEHGWGILCMDIQRDQMVSGSSDHGLRQYDIQTGKFMRQLYSKQHGHQDWVTSCQFLQKGQIVSSGMDGVLCLWHPRLVKCSVLGGHKGSITKVLVDEHDICISGGYDGNLLVWDLEGLEMAQRLDGVHEGAITDFQWRNSLVVSGDKRGCVSVWDINKCVSVNRATRHCGGVSKVSLFADQTHHNLILTLGNEGAISILDMRTSQSIYHQKIHRSPPNDLQIHNNQIVSVSDQIHLIDFSHGFDSQIQIPLQSQNINSIQLYRNLLFSATNKGNLLVHDIHLQQSLYAYGCMSKGSLRQIQFNPAQDTLVCIGDDPSPLILYYH